MSKLGTKIIALASIGFFSATLPGCTEKEKGPAEKAGKAIDEAVDDVKEEIEDATDEDGPLEKAGEAVDDAVKDAKKKLERDK